MRAKLVAVRLTEPELAALQVLTGGASREEWLRVQIREGITRRLAINNAAIAQFRDLATKASRRAEGNTAEEAADARREAAEYRGLIAKYEAENLTLYKGRLEAAEGL